MSFSLISSISGFSGIGKRRVLITGSNFSQTQKTYNGVLYNIIDFFASGTINVVGGSITINCLVVGGGGGGAFRIGTVGGGGGAGGESTLTTYTFTPGTYTITIGSGGTAGNSIIVNGGTGSASSIGSITANGGAGGIGGGNGGTGINGGGSGGKGGTENTIVSGNGIDGYNYNNILGGTLDGTTNIYFGGGGSGGAISSQSAPNYKYGGRGGGGSGVGPLAYSNAGNATFWYLTKSITGTNVNATLNGVANSGGGGGGGNAYGSGTAGSGGSGYVGIWFVVT
jgi:hypothetical protein